MEIEAKVNGHTPGPWRGDCNHRNVIGNGRDVARVFGKFEDNEADANAFLVAAAPDLLAALEAIATHDSATCQGVTASDCLESVQEIARVAIKKAKGE